MCFYGSIHSIKWKHKICLKAPSFDEDKQILGFDDNQTSSSSISNDSTHSSKSIPKSQFMTFPSLSLYTSESLLDEDWNSFINQIPAYGSFSIVC